MSASKHFVMDRASLNGELAAAKAVAAKAGLGEVSPAVIAIAKHNSVRLSPLGIVARILSARSYEDSRELHARELIVANQLAHVWAPTVRPLTIAEPGPYFENGCLISLWEFTPGRRIRSRADELLAARALRQVHEALARIKTHLPSFMAAIDSCETLLRNPRKLASLPMPDLRFMEGLFADLRNDLERRTLVYVPIHGDSHLANARITGGRAVWMDLEAVCIGPIEWDVVTLPVRIWPQFGDLDAELMSLLGNLRSLCVAIWCWADFYRTAEIAEAATYHLSKLKKRFCQ